MVMSVFIGLGEILFRLLVEGFLAAERAEVVSLPVVLGLACRGCGIDIHVADGVMHSGCHKSVSFSGIIMHLKDNLNERHITADMIRNSPPLQERRMAGFGIGKTAYEFYRFTT